MKVLLVRPHLILALSRRCNAFLHLEPLDLEIVAGGVAPSQAEAKAQAFNASGAEPPAPLQL